MNGAVRKGERVVPPSSLELLMRATFPANAARVKVNFFEAISICYVSIRFFVSCLLGSEVFVLSLCSGD